MDTLEQIKQNHKEKNKDYSIIELEPNIFIKSVIKFFHLDLYMFIFCLLLFFSRLKSLILN
jgi:hypothetical protein